MPIQARYGWILLAAACSLTACRDKSAPTIAAKRAAAEDAPISADKTQLVSVVSDDWKEFRATLRRYERVPGKRWKPVGRPVDVVIGREGYGWGRGLHGSGAPKGRPGPVKREGDGRSPAGVFGIGTAYGYDAVQEGLSLPYVQATPELRCVDDPHSSHYNRIVSTADTEVDWQSAERMRRDDGLYVLAIVVEHNTDAPKPRAGSCIFIHLWEGPDEGMSGCTAMPMDALKELAAWLRPDAAALVALPRSEYEALRRPWDLPVIPLPGQFRSSSDERR
jgi:D-alanyl-D-alanine dipeptidase